MAPSTLANVHNATLYIVYLSQVFSLKDGKHLSASQTLRVSTITLYSVHSSKVCRPVAGGGREFVVCGWGGGPLCKNVV